MKDAQKYEQKLETEPIAEKNNVQKKIANVNKAIAFSVALSQGTLLQALGSELYEGLGMLGNYTFLQALERKENRNRVLRRYVDEETFSRDKVSIIKDRLSDMAEYEANVVELVPDLHVNHGIPQQALGDSARLSFLTPSPFEQCFCGLPANADTDQGSSADGGQGTGDAP